MPITDMSKRADELLKAIKNSTQPLKASVEFKSIGKVELSEKQCAHLCKGAGLTYHKGLEDRVINFRFTNTKVDLDGDVLVSKGADLSVYKRNPVILGQHDGRTFPIGISLQTKYRKEEEDIVGKVLFFDKEIDNTGLSETFYNFYKNGAMKGGSIGFDADYKNVQKPSPEEKDFYKMPDHGLIFYKYLILEYSLVTLQANTDCRPLPTGKALDEALELMKSKGAITDDFITKLRESEPKPKKEIGKMSVKIFINDSDSPELKESKNKMAKEQRESGQDVELIFGEPQKSVVNNVITGLSDEQKESVSKAIEAIDSIGTLKETFQNLLKSAGDEKPKGEVTPESDETEPENDQYKSLGGVLSKILNNNKGD